MEQQDQIVFMPKREGWLAASDIPHEGVITTITDVIPGAEHGIKNRILLQTAGFDDPLILTKGDTDKLIAQWRTAESDDWIGKSIKITITPRQFAGKKVWGMAVDPYWEETGQ